MIRFNEIATSDHREKVSESSSPSLLAWRPEYILDSATEATHPEAVGPDAHFLQLL